jgi:hypothetical protein
MPNSEFDRSEVDTPVDSIQKFVIAGWTGRNPEHVRKHIEELQAIGVRPPTTVPVFYEVSPASMTSRNEIVVVGPETSGEVEFVLIQTANETLVTVGSDHTDRWLETVSVHHSKQICSKPVAARAWPLRELAARWDQLILRAYSVHDGRRRLYQEGSVAGMLAPEVLLERYRDVGGEFRVNTGMSCGTLALRDGIEYGETFEIELEDPVQQRSLRHRYRVRSIAIAS